MAEAKMTLEEEQRLRAVSLLQRKPSAQDLQAQAPQLRALLDEAQRATLWAQAENIFGGLKDISDHCRRTANELERNLMELEGMLGKVPKKP